jgi:hypothetical protein
MRERQLWQRAVSLCLAITVLGAHATRGGARGAAVLAGSLDCTGRVTVDGRDTITGATFFPGGRVVTADGSEATISLGELGRVRYAPNSDGVLSFAEAATSGHLEGGLLTVSKPVGVSATFTTKDGTVAADAREAAVFSVEVNEGGTVVSSLSGRVQLRSGDGTREVAAGESASAGQGGGAARGNGLSTGKRWALGLTIGGMIAIIILSLRGDADPPPQFGDGPNPSPSR